MSDSHKRKRSVSRGRSSTKRFKTNSKKSTSSSKTRNASRTKRSKSLSRGRSRNRSISSSPIQFGTGHWKSFGKGPKGSKKRQGLIKKLEKLLPPQVYTTTSGYQVKTTAGLQAIGIVASTYDPYDLYTYNGGQLQATTLIGQNKVILKDYTTTINFTNQTNANIKVMFYDFIARKDLIVWTNESAETPLAAWNYENTIATSYSNTAMGATPFDSQLLCKTWKVINSQEYRLAEGETGEHRIHGTMNKIFDMSNLAAVTNAGTVGNLVALVGGLKGLTHYTMVVVSGSATDNSNTTVGSSIAKVDFSTTNRYVWEQVITTAQNAITVNNLSTATGTTYNQGSGDDVTIANN